MLLAFWFAIAAVLVRVSTATSPLWWSWNSHIASDPKKAKFMCNGFEKFNKKQRGLCVKYPDLMQHVFHGAKVAVDECARQLSTDRWNCSNVPEQGSLFGPILTAGCRESAFLYAITSAGVAHSITTACSSGVYRSCGCDTSKRPRPTGDWKWSGCHSNVKFGASFTMKFANARDTKDGSTARKKMNRHNIRAGVRALAKLTLKKCKCHGVSGSCEVKTCWMKHAKDFDTIGQHVRTKYREAIEMVKVDKGKKVLQVKDARSRKPTSAELIYYEPSPNFCDTNPTSGTPGTSGRVCNITSSDIDGCNLLCCGRGYDVQLVNEMTKCNCRFVWCCHVVCESCKRTREIHTCK